MLKDKNVLLAISGGIAAYKAVELASKLKKNGAKVRTIMTEHACRFVSPLTVRTITDQNVHVEMFDPQDHIAHISLADWADIMVIAPATANIIGKVAGGIADDLLSTTIMATKIPVLFVPAMNVHMYENVIVQKNLKILEKAGYFVMEPEVGRLACGYEGKGRYPDNLDIIDHLKTYLHYKKDLIEKKILITAGASCEMIDPMRYISNLSSGRMGIALAKAAAQRGADVKLLYGNITERIPGYIHGEQAVSAEQMYSAVIRDAENADFIFMAAAVADYTPHGYSEQKLKKAGDLTLQLKRTKDILKELGEIKQKGLIGFAAESEDLIANAIKKLESKNLDMIVANLLSTAGAEDTQIKMITRKKEITEISGDKFSVAHSILNEVKKLQ